MFGVWGSNDPWYWTRIAYHFGDTHTFSGSDEVTISTPIGLLIVMTSIPISLGSRASIPPEYFRMGRIAVGNADGWAPAWPLEHEENIMPLPPFRWTRLGVQLVPGATCVVTELLGN